MDEFPDSENTQGRAAVHNLIAPAARSFVSFNTKPPDSMFPAEIWVYPEAAPVTRFFLRLTIRRTTPKTGQLAERLSTPHSVCPSLSHERQVTNSVCGEPVAATWSDDINIDQEKMNQVYDGIVEIIPQLRRYALTLCRNRTAADDLMQESIVRALAKSQLFKADTNLRAWVFTIMHNVFVSSCRRGKLTELPMDPEIAAARISVQPTQELTLEVNALIRAMKGIPETQRDAVLMVDHDGMTYENIAAHLNVPIGTIKSRVSRGRAALRVAMHG